MGEMLDAMIEHRKEVQARKQAAMARRSEWFKSSGLQYEIMSELGGHYRVFANGKRYDVWISSGKWTEVGTNKYRNGWKKIMKIVGAKNTCD